MATYDTTVCIVGAGPAGLVTATALTRAGMPFLLLDSGDGGVGQSRAGVLHAGALEVRNRGARGGGSSSGHRRTRA